jgi:signal peptidase I
MATVARKQRKPKAKSSVAALREGHGARGGGKGQETASGAGTKRRKAWENFKSIATTLALFLLIRAFLIEAYRIPSESMTPALLVGDWLFVNKLRFGPNIPFTSVNLPGYAEPHRHDVVVFKSPTQIDQPEDPNPTLVKRIIGMPGDTLHMRGAKLFVNGITQSEPYAAESEPGADEISALFDWQKQYALTASRFGPAPDQPTHDNWGPLVVPPRHYFMMGDNRYNSKDSRYWGLVPRENIRGRPMFVYYSWNAVDSDRPLPALTDIRWGRIGHWIR